LNEGDVIAQPHSETSGAFDAGIRYEADEDNLLDPVLLEVGVKIGNWRSRFGPSVHSRRRHREGPNSGVEFSAPSYGSQALDLVSPKLGWIHMLPPLVSVSRQKWCGDDDDLDTRRSDCSNQLAHIVVEADRFSRVPSGLV